MQETSLTGGGVYGGTEAACESQPAIGIEAESPPARRMVPPLRVLRKLAFDRDCRNEAVHSTKGERLSAAERLNAAESLTDAELVTLALNGAVPAFSHLVERHARHVQRLIARRLRNPEDVLDVIQDTRLAVWRALHHYDARRPFEAWLTSIALNKCRDLARRRTAQHSLLLRLQANVVADGADSGDCSPERRMIGEEGVGRLQRALDGLPPQLRAPLVLTALRDESQAATARALGLTRKAVEMRVRRARQHLERSLHDGCPSN